VPHVHDPSHPLTLFSSSSQVNIRNTDATEDDLLAIFVKQLETAGALDEEQEARDREKYRRLMQDTAFEGEGEGSDDEAGHFVKTMD
jgi:hypothetical protein